MYFHTILSYPSAGLTVLLYLLRLIVCVAFLKHSDTVTVPPALLGSSELNYKNKNTHLVLAQSKYLTRGYIKT